MANGWLITGTSSGFGRTLTELALERGDNVAATVRKRSALDDLKERFGNRLRVSILDVTSPKEIVSVVDEAFDAFGKIDFAVSNADTSWSAQRKKQSCQGLSACLIRISWEAFYSRKLLFLTCASRAVAEFCKSRASRVRWPILA